MINIIINGLLDVIIFLCNLILTPINLLIDTVLPDLSLMLDSVPLMFDKASVYLNWVISLSGLSTLAIQFIILYFTFKLTVPLTVHVIKFVVKWYNALKP